MKDELPLTDRDFADVRKSVMAAIEARQTRRVWTVRAMELAFVVLVLTIGAWWMVRPANKTAPSPVPSAPQETHMQDNTKDQLSPMQQSTIQQAQTQQPASHSLVATSEPRTRRTVRTASRRQHRRTPVHEIANLTEPLRLELKTDDPDIRIIWITNPTNSR